jgi:hypothetical protein
MSSILVGGAILAHGTRTVTQALRVMGLSEERRWTNYHRVLNRAVWSPLQASKILLGLILRLLPVSSTIVIGADDTTSAAEGEEDQACRRLSRWRAVIEEACREMLRLEVGRDDGVGEGAFQFACLGATVSHRAWTTHKGSQEEHTTGH